MPLFTTPWLNLASSRLLWHTPGQKISKTSSPKPSCAKQKARKLACIIQGGRLVNRQTPIFSQNHALAPPGLRPLLARSRFCERIALFWGKKSDEKDLLHFWKLAKKMLHFFEISYVLLYWKTPNFDSAKIRDKKKRRNCRRVGLGNPPTHHTLHISSWWRK